ncbi:MAG: TraR/DksA family transcriptional regulator, partial [Chloroflexi bacterium]|nr:TraR/DksA family transcriptional regulator [Chloroflexota bacterium]
MATCAGCGVPIAEERAVFVAGKRASDAPLALCPVCAEKIEQALQVETEHPNIALAVIFALATALLTAFVWYQIVVLTEMQLGIVAIGVGWAIARAVIYASGNKRGPALQWISATATLFAMLVAQYLIVRHYLGQVLIEEGFTSQLPLFLPIGMIFEMVK